MLKSEWNIEQHEHSNVLYVYLCQLWVVLMCKHCELSILKCNFVLGGTIMRTQGFNMWRDSNKGIRRRLLHTLFCAIKTNFSERFGSWYKILSLRPRSNARESLTWPVAWTVGSLHAYVTTHMYCLKVKVELCHIFMKIYMFIVTVYFASLKLRYVRIIYLTHAQGWCIATFTFKSCEFLVS